MTLQECLNKWLALDIDIPADLPSEPYDSAYEMRAICLLAFKEFLIKLDVWEEENENT